MPKPDKKRLASTAFVESAAVHPSSNDAEHRHKRPSGEGSANAKESSRPSGHGTPPAASASSARKSTETASSRHPAAKQALKGKAEPNNSHPAPPASTAFTASPVRRPVEGLLPLPPPTQALAAPEASSSSRRTPVQTAASSSAVGCLGIPYTRPPVQPAPDDAPIYDAALTEAEKKALVARGELKTHSWSFQDNQLLQANVEDFLGSNHGVTLEMLLEPNTRVPEFWKRISRGTGHMVAATKAHCLALWKKRTNELYNVPFSTDEDRRLLALYAVHGSKWSEISKAMGRTPQSLADRYKLLNVSTKGHWRQDEEARLCKAMMELYPDLLSRDLEAEAGDASASYSEGFRVRNWSAIAERVQTRVAKQCRQKWHDYFSAKALRSILERAAVDPGSSSASPARTSQAEETQPPASLFVLQEAFSKGDYVELLNKLRRSAWTHTSEVDWKVLAQGTMFGRKRMRAKWVKMAEYARQQSKSIDKDSVQSVAAFISDNIDSFVKSTHAKRSQHSRTGRFKSKEFVSDSDSDSGSGSDSDSGAGSGARKKPRSGKTAATLSTPLGDSDSDDGHSEQGALSSSDSD